MAIKHFCDRCGKEIKTRNCMRITVYGMWRGSLEDVELCEDCMPIVLGQHNLDKLKADEAERKAKAEARKKMRAAKAQQLGEMLAERSLPEEKEDTKDVHMG